MKNRKGFTLVELLAAMVILGLIMGIAIPNIMGVIKSNKEKTYVADAKKLLSVAEYKFRGDSKITRPSSTSNCTVMSLNYLDNGEFEKDPNGKAYNKDKSFVTITKEGSTYVLYVTLVDSKGKGVEYKKLEELDDNKASSVISERVNINFDGSNVSGKCTCSPSGCYK